MGRIVDRVRAAVQAAAEEERLPSTREVGYGVSADWQYRTTPDDIRADIAEMAKVKVGPFLAKYVDGIMAKSFRQRDLDDIGLDGWYRIKGMLERSRAEYMRQIQKPVRPSKTPKPARMPMRTDGPCSPVVVTTRHGEVWCKGKNLTSPEEIAAALVVTP